MTDTDTIVCPECDCEQPQSAPFCENCGYRMTAPKTMREPMMALTPERVEGLEKRRKRPSKTKRPAKKPESGSTDSRPMRKMVAPTEEPESTQQGAELFADEEVTQNREPSHTLVEGLRAVSKTEPEFDRSDVSEPIASVNDGEQDGTSTSARNTATSAPAPETSKKLIIIVAGTVLGCLLLVGGLSWLHLERQAEAADNTVVWQPEIVEIGEGHFRRGLADDAQAFIMLFCQRYYDNPGEECERERLLAGEYPQQTVKMPAYAMDRGPVRNNEYQQCVRQGSCEAIDWDACQVWTPRGLQLGARVPQILRREDHPVVCVDRERAEVYCQWRDGDLPSHNQWEKAARGRNASLYPWGDYWEPDHANWGERDVMRTSVAGKLDGFAWTSPPGSFPDGTSPFGLHDMAGNVAEWVRGEDPLRGHVRGGSWVSNPFELRTTARKEVDVDAVRTDIGFRCAYPR